MYLFWLDVDNSYVVVAEYQIVFAWLWGMGIAMLLSGYYLSFLLAWFAAASLSTSLYFESSFPIPISFIRLQHTWWIYNFSDVSYIFYYFFEMCFDSHNKRFFCDVDPSKQLLSTGNTIQQTSTMTMTNLSFRKFLSCLCVYVVRWALLMYDHFADLLYIRSTNDKTEHHQLLLSSIFPFVSHIFISFAYVIIPIRVWRW